MKRLRCTSSTVEKVLDEKGETVVVLSKSIGDCVYTLRFSVIIVCSIGGIQKVHGGWRIWNVWICIDTVHGKQLAMFVQQ